jgi:hypothetical protein
VKQRKEITIYQSNFLNGNKTGAAAVRAQTKNGSRIGDILKIFHFLNVFLLER